MPKYVYGCPTHKKVRLEITHGISEKPLLMCKQCEEPLQRIPQPFSFYNNPTDVLGEYIDQGYRNYRNKSRKRGRK